MRSLLHTAALVIGSIFVYGAAELALPTEDFDNPPLPSYGFPIPGGSLMELMILKPQWVKSLSVVFAGYTVLFLYLTA